MAFESKDLKGLLTLKFKSRHDNFTDQYNRIFMVKLTLVCTLVLGVNWYTEKVACIIPGAHKIDGKFVGSACWIQGVYVYKELRSRVDEVAYYGMPKDIVEDGYLYDNPEQLCTLQPKLGKVNPHCRPMTKTFFLQYQYFPFLFGVFAFLFYLPYIVFRSANADLISLKNNVKSDAPDADKIAKHYFDTKTNSTRKSVYNVLVKLLYLAANLFCFLGLNSLLDGEYTGYGGKWVKWSRLENHIQYDYLGFRDHPKPGNELLPPFGYCEIHASAKDIKESYANKHKFVCEMSQYVLYQYALLVFWFALIAGIIFSCLGLIVLLAHYAIGIFGFKAHGSTGKKLFKMLSFRELEYLEFMRKRDLGLYGKVLHKLREIKLGPNDPGPKDTYAQHHGDDIPLYPRLPERDRYV